MEGVQGREAERQDPEQPRTQWELGSPAPWRAAKVYVTNKIKKHPPREVPIKKLSTF